MINFGCKNTQNTPESETPSVIFIGHCRNDKVEYNYVDPRAVQFYSEKAKCKVFLGDLAYATTKDSNILETLNRIDTLNDPSILIAPGNHDIQNRDILHHYFEKTNPMVFRMEDMLIISLDTERDLGSITEDQINKLDSIMSRHHDIRSLVVATHQLIWLQDDGKLQSMADSLINGYVGNCSYCLHENNFYSHLLPFIRLYYPNIPLYFVAGDIGHKTDKVEIQYDENTWFLAVGGQEGKAMSFLKMYRNSDGLPSYRFISK